MFFYLVTTGWIFDISLCENSINQSIFNQSKYLIVFVRFGNQCAKCDKQQTTTPTTVVSKVMLLRSAPASNPAIASENYDE